jgi:RNA polymerase sigma-70 factor, ECF subfamily
MRMRAKPEGHPMATADDVEVFIRERRRDLVRFAALQLRDQALAEDVVQDTSIAALQGAGQFSGRSSIRTWVYSILKRKIIDAFHARSREITVSELTTGDDDQDVAESLFNQRGFWATEHRPHRWTEPEDTLEQQQFWTVFEVCLDQLPAKLSRVFMMREMLEMDTDTICKELGITTSNCWVILHRARMGLRLCLDERWFARR